MRGIKPVLCAVVVVALCMQPSRVTADGDREFMAKLVAQTFFRGLLEGSILSVVPLCAKRVNLDGHWVQDHKELEKRLRTIGIHAREHGVKLRRVVILDYGTVTRRFGRPPARLRGAAGPGKLIALVRFNTVGAVAVLGRVGAFWKVVALTD